MSASSIEVDKSYLELPLMKQAFIHKSVSSAQNNERLEFLAEFTHKSFSFCNINWLLGRQKFVFRSEINVSFGNENE